jgi:hypothetical protein
VGLGSFILIPFLIRMVLRTPAHAERKKSGAALPRSAGASLVGTVVGAFFGVQAGAVGKERAEAARERSEQEIKAALSMFPPESAEQLRAEMNR